jgi:hypothetical protein
VRGAEVGKSSQNGFEVGTEDKARRPRVKLHGLSRAKALEFMSENDRWGQRRGVGC